MRATNEHAKPVPLSQLPRHETGPMISPRSEKPSPFQPETPCRYYAKSVLATSKFAISADLTHAILPSAGQAASFPRSRRPAAPLIAPVAQLDRAPDYGSGGWEFESLRARHFFNADGAFAHATRGGAAESRALGWGLARRRARRAPGPRPLWRGAGAPMRSPANRGPVASADPAPSPVPRCRRPATPS